MTKEELLAAFRAAFDAGREQGQDEATSYEWGSRPDQTADKAFAALLKSWNPDGAGIRKALVIIGERA